MVMDLSNFEEHETIILPFWRASKRSELTERKIGPVSHLGLSSHINYLDPGPLNDQINTFCMYLQMKTNLGFEQTRFAASKATFFVS